MNNQKTIFRFSILERIEHWVLFLSFTTLALTGLPQKYATAGISQALISLFGGIDTIRVIHHVAAAIFLLEAVYHLVIVGYKLFVRRVQATMLPGVKDATDALQAFKYNLGLSKDAPKLPRYNFAEKAEYWAMIWGLLIMGLTGLMLWNPIFTARTLPGQFIPAAKAAHGAEAVLAVLAIIVWHFYNVHLKSWNWSMIKGTMTRHQMEEEHGEELATIDAGQAQNASIAPEVLRRRKLLYFPIATVVAVLLAFGIYFILTAERTAILTVPPAESGVPVFSAATPSPVPTSASPTEAAPAPTTETGGTSGGATSGALTWDASIGPLLSTKCGACHGTSGGLALDSYANALKGGSTGPAIVPGDPSTSQLVLIQQAGNHPGQLTQEELQQVIAWIQAGAPEK